MTFSSIAGLHPLEIASMLTDMSRRISVDQQYVNVIVEEADLGRADLIAQRIYGDTQLLWVVAKFAGIKSMQDTLVAGKTLQLPSLQNVAQALRKERTEGIPVFSYTATQEEIDSLTEQTNQSQTNQDDIFEELATETIFVGQPIILTADGKVSLAENNGTEYRVHGIALTNSAGNAPVSYTTVGEVEIANWSILTSEAATNPTVGKIVYLAETGRGMLTLVPPQSAGKHAVKIGSIRTGEKLFVDVGTPIGL
jgi:hypothetical protein